MGVSLVMAGKFPTRRRRSLARLGIGDGGWLSLVRGYGRHWRRAVGSPERLRRWAERWGKSWSRGVAASRLVYG